MTAEQGAAAAYLDLVQLHAQLEINAATATGLFDSPESRTTFAKL